MAEDESKLEEWKQKYFDALGQVEDLEKRIAQANELCERGFGRLSLAAQGAHDTLDTHLGALRASLKADFNLETLSPIIDDISDAVTHLEEQRKASDSRYAPMLKPLVEPFDNDRLAKKHQKLFRPLEASITDLKPDFNLETWLLDYSRQLRLLLDQFLNASEGNDSGLLSKLFKGGSDSEAATGDLTGLATQINQALIKLLDEIPLPSAFEPQMQSAQKTLEGNTDIQQLPEILDHIVSLLIKASQEEAEEFTSFLRSLNERLDSIQHYLEESTKDKSESVKERTALDSAVRTQVAEIQQSINSSSSIDELKNSIQTRLSVITDQMDEFRASEERRQSSEAERITALTAQLEATEQESQKLRQALIEQQARAHKDPLTHIPNRQAYNERLAYEEARFKRYKAPVSMVVCDIDHFKRFNDDFGHLAGDKVLCTVANVIAENVRSTDFAARYGGEEFVILMPETTKEQAKVVAEKLRQAIASQTFKFRDQSMSVTMSFGVAQFIDDKTGEDVFHIADKALYKAKESGRNQVCIDE